MWKIYYYDKNNKARCKIEKGYLNPVQFCKDETKLEENSTGDIIWEDEVFKAWYIEDDYNDYINDLTEKDFIQKYGKRWHTAASMILGYTAASKRFNFKLWTDLEKTEEYDNTNNNLAFFYNKILTANNKTSVEKLHYYYVMMDSIIESLKYLKLLTEKALDDEINFKEE